ncbi:FtsK/SpoIIIE domain-containing protein [Heyndrickxia sp. FSL K6-6286]|uniref:FtsK/SpoIIIE domain-containing protein n=1 Tax=Heyndrickxia sp. FSL K6-6286 TaxID=2921510 RepID=UPI00315B256F
MLLEVVSSVLMGGVLAGTYAYQLGAGGNDTKNICRIAENAGLVARDGTKIRIHRRKQTKGYSEYVYQMPQGLSSKQFQDNIDRFQDGLNTKKKILDVSITDIKSIDWKSDVMAQVRNLFTEKIKLRKEVTIDFDGMLIFRVYKTPLPDVVPFDNSLFDKCTGWNIPLGVSRFKFEVHDFEDGHLIISGSTRYGKSVFLKNIITSLIHRKPNEVTFHLIDLKGGLTFSRFANARQVKTVATNVDETLESLKVLLTDIEQKQADFLRNGWEDVREARIKDRTFIVVDEAAQLASAGITDAAEKKKRIECETILAKIAQVGAGLGYRLIFCTQYPTADTLPRQIKQNVDSRLCFRLQTTKASEVVLDSPGAEKLPKIRGRGIYQTPDGKKIVQTPFIQNDFIERTIAPHIIIKPRKDELHAQDDSEGTKAIRNSLIVSKA